MHLGRMRTPARRIANEEAMEAALLALGGVQVRRVEFSALSWRAQMELVASSDLLLGMHGAGLTHLLWLPPHAGARTAFVSFGGMRQTLNNIAKRLLLNITHKNRQNQVIKNKQSQIKK